MVTGVVALELVMPVPYFREAVVTEALIIFIGVGMLAGDVSGAVMTALEFTTSKPEENLSGWAPFGCRGLTVSNCACVLQASMPSYHVWRYFLLPPLPQFLNQEPPRPQQLALPDFSMTPHLWHMNPLGIVVAVAVSVHV